MLRIFDKSVSSVYFGLALVAMICPALAQQRGSQPQAASQAFLLGTFDDWKALMSGKDRAKMCYALATPKDRKPAGLKRDPAHLFVSNRVADGTKNEIAFRLGFATKSGQDGTLQIGTARFALLTNDEQAFLKNAAQEAQVIEAMKKAGDLTVKVASVRGNETTDRYSLKGFGKALERMQKECP